MWTVCIPKRVDKELFGLSPELKTSVEEAIGNLKTNPYPHGRKKLKGIVNAWRIQVRNYRVLYDIDDTRHTITLLKIGRRREDTYRFL